MNPDELDNYARREGNNYANEAENGERRYATAYTLGVYRAKYAELWHECQRLRREAEEARPKVMILGEPI